MRMYRFILNNFREYVCMNQAIIDDNKTLLVQIMAWYQASKHEAVRSKFHDARWRQQDPVNPATTWTRDIDNGPCLCLNRSDKYPKTMN